MSQPINITTLAGVRLDVNPSATIELNMGGISLLSLADRPATYTNSFSLPRTPTNERVFAFASQPTRNNKPSISCYLSKGLYQKKIELTVDSFESGYKCSANYENSIKAIKATNIYDLFEDNKVIYSSVTPIPESILILNAYDKTNESFYALSNGRMAYQNVDSANNMCSKITTIFDLISGVAFDGTLFDDADFLNMALLIQNNYLEYQTGGGVYKLVQKKNTTTDKLLLSDVLKAISQYFMCDVIFSENRVTLNKLDLSVAPIQLEGFTFSKKYGSGYGAINYINLDIIDKNVSSGFCGDTFLGDGVETKEVLKINSKVPYFISGTRGGYDLIKDIKKGDICLLFIDSGLGLDVSFYGSTFYNNIDVAKANILTMSGYYSSILNSIFWFNDIIGQVTNILDASKWLDPFTANQIMESRIINSVQLGGRYWVDTMAYNLTTGQSKMTLIKI